jgi:hypothetical protein
MTGQKQPDLREKNWRPHESVVLVDPGGHRGPLDCGLCRLDGVVEEESVLSLHEWFVVGITFLILAFACFVIWVFQSFKPEK